MLLTVLVFLKVNICSNLVGLELKGHFCYL